MTWSFPLVRGSSRSARAAVVALVASVASVGGTASAPSARAGSCEASRVVVDHPPVKVGAIAPVFGGWTVENAVIGSKDLRRTNPGAVVVVSFFATWCEPCKRGLPQLARLQRELGEKVSVVLVAFGQDAREVKPFLRDVGVQLPVVVDPFEKLSARFGVSEALPRTFVLAPDDTVAAIYECEGDDFLASLVAQVERLQKKAAAAR